ncbi:TIR domain-containing protein [Brevibacillus thermoruber]|uniref:TIR domain-containing protein n=1 Tax=Brevibacillus thermoruber TaxID=33942 RepID=UPI0006867831|nr:TIR domain-containing protein [Brevibacillus thermoruber]
MTVWPNGVFDPSSFTIIDLTRQLDHTDFAIFVFHPDDEMNIRGEQSTAVRDNVLFEFGLFIGRLGVERVFYVLPRSKRNRIHIPTDLIGVTPGIYEDDRRDGNLVSAVNAFCNQFRRIADRLGPLNNVHLTERVNKLESHARFLYYLLQWSKRSDIQYNQIMSAFKDEFETVPPFNKKKAVTLFRLTDDEKGLEQIGCAGMVRDEKVFFSLDHNENHPENQSFVVHAYHYGYGLFETGKRVWMQDEFIYTRRIADRYVIYFHFLADQTVICRLR